MASAGEPYAVHYHVRFDEAGPDGLLRTSGLLRYTQDLAAQHSEALGYDRAWYRERGLTWLVRAAEVDVLGAIGYGAGLAASTRVLGFRRVWSRRESAFRLGEALVAVVRIDWLLLDERGAPARIPVEIESAFPGTGGPTPLQLARVPLAEAPEGVRARSFAVRPQELDPLDHVNNAIYADWVDEAIVGVSGDGAAAVGTVPRRVRLEYALAASPGDRLTAASWDDDGGWSCRISRNTDGADLVRARLEPGRPR
ncbi:MAG TPA: acyl-ACP thioesterase domain-containing protein [Clostridia bacterium]|nr:acyl-ACP thioesterase domain-containing protein [Clostridia bacterium]